MHNAVLLNVGTMVYRSLGPAFKLLEESIEGKLLDRGPGNKFLDLTPKVQAIE